MSAWRRLGPACLVLAFVAAAWSAVTAISGGFIVDAGVRLSVRDPIRPLVVALLLMAAARLALPASEFRRTLSQIAGRDRGTLAARAALAVSAGVLVFSLAWNTRAIGGSDSSCYVLQAEAFAQGRATLTPPLGELPPGATPGAFAPAGFVASPSPPFAAVPICGAGLALVMAPAVLAGRDLVFLVVPCFAALAVWCTFLLGRALDDEVTGVGAAALLACSPIFLYQAVQPMSDVPAAALWLAALVALAAPSPRTPGAAGGRARPILAGVCASAAVLMRPNIALIVVPLVALLPNARAWVRFGVASLPAFLVMAALNAARYGSPLASGYGSTDALFSLAHVGPNLARYPRWLLETQTPFLLLAVAAPALLWRRGLGRLGLVGAAGVTLTVATYLAYAVFDDWWYIRFLLPALPVLLAFSVLALRAALSWRPWPVAPIAVVLVSVVLGGWLIHVARVRHVLDLAAFESRFRLTGEYAGRALPADAVVLAVQHSGSVRYYGRRATLAWDALAPNGLEGTIAWLRAQGRTPFLVLEDGEDARFRARFGAEGLGALDWPPQADVHGPGRVRIYNPDDRPRYRRGERVATEEIRGR
jgi:hypothetical protein